MLAKFLPYAIDEELHATAAGAHVDIEVLPVLEKFAKLAETLQRVPSWNFLVPMYWRLFVQRGQCIGSDSATRHSEKRRMVGAL